MRNLSFKSLCFFVLLFLRLSADVDSIAERIRNIEEQRGYYPKKEKSFHGIVGAELLYWKADVDGVAYATKSRIVQAKGQPGNVSTNIQTLSPHFDYDPGFRVYLGMQSPFDLFDVVLVWTRFTTEGHDSVRGTRVSGDALPGDKVLFDGIGLIKELDTVPDHAKSSCCFKGNLLDLQLGRGIAMSKRFFFRPYFGVRALWSEIDWHIAASRHFLAPNAFAQDSTKLRVDNRFRAIGGLFGATVDWKLPMGFGITTRVAGALVYGLSVEATRQKYLFLPAFAVNPEEDHYKAHSTFHCTKGLWEVFGGFYWETRVPKPKKYRLKEKHFQLRLFMGYELQQWPYIAQKTNIQSLRERDRYSLGFEGFTGGLGVVF